MLLQIGVELHEATVAALPHPIEIRKGEAQAGRIGGNAEPLDVESGVTQLIDVREVELLGPRRVVLVDQQGLDLLWISTHRRTSLCGASHP